MAAASQEFKASAAFVQNLSSGVVNAWSTMDRLRRKVLRVPEEDMQTLTPKSVSTVAQLPSNVLRRKQGSSMRAANANQSPTVRSSRVSFHMPEEDESDSPKRAYSQSSLDLEMSPGLAAAVSRPSHGHKFLGPDVTSSSALTEAPTTPSVSRSMSTMSMASMASQGPCHMALFVESTPKHNIQDAGHTPVANDAEFGFGI